jgi:hypothetical protein
VKYDQRSYVTTCPFPDILENLFDGAHIVQLHHAAKMPQLTNMSDRPHGMYLEYAIDAQAEDQPIEQIVMNLSGISLLNQHYVARGWEALFFIALTPLDGERTEQSMSLYLKDLGSQEAHDALGKPFVERFVYEVEQDLKVLDFKKHYRNRSYAGEMGRSTSTGSMRRSIWAVDQRVKAEECEQADRRAAMHSGTVIHGCSANSPSRPLTAAGHRLLPDTLPGHGTPSANTGW